MDERDKEIENILSRLRNQRPLQSDMKKWQQAIAGGSNAKVMARISKSYYWRFAPVAAALVFGIFIGSRADQIAQRLGFHLGAVSDDAEPTTSAPAAVSSLMKTKNYVFAKATKS